MCSCLLFWYLIFTICSLLSLFYRIIEYFFFNGMQLGDLATYLQIFALCFFGTLSIQKFSEKKPGQKEEKLIDKKDLKTRVDGKRLKITYQDNIGLGVRVK